MIFIFSLSRSGSTWLGKIFDSHPDVFYLHEPDIADRGLDLLPYWFEDEPACAQVKAARAYLDRLAGARTARATGTRPFFRKRYRGSVSEQLRRALIYLAKGLERAGLLDSNHVEIPDFFRANHAMKTVVKSVTAHGRANAFLKACANELQPILLLRDPRAYVSSMIRGTRMAVMEPPMRLGALLRTQSALRIGLSPSSFGKQEEIETHAWTWLLANMEADAAIRAAGGTTVIYETLANNVTTEVKSLFKQMRLNWAPETERFVRLSAKHEGEYYSVFRDPARAANRWRDELSNDTIARVRAIVTLDPIGQSYFRTDP